ncbi:RHS repeat-associated core domain-containing protein [Frigoriglobus tundricola]|uniref:Rhs-family protein n=1 Tax=Frigoriglobus tundricola TaxID=2774151 RepID=A0A6M5YYD7_9BACT|nr:RHS repeat-associated core domain-containing protein [Frigoriglobus tundricola]QJW98446.1 hypothetical protein FTUN_6036 [Frigoriglobus tundricola]
MYDPSIGRWLTPDPTGFSAGDVDLYRFVGNNPVNATDPSGLAELFGLQKKLDAATRDSWKNDPASYKDKLIVVPDNPDIEATLKKIGIKKGELFKYVVTKDGKVVFFRHEINHPFGPAQAGGEVGEDVLAAGYARYYGKLGDEERLIFDTITGHYKIKDESDARKKAAQDQAKEAFKKIGIPGARWERDDRKGVENFLDTEPKRKDK